MLYWYDKIYQGQFGWDQNFQAFLKYPTTSNIIRNIWKPIGFPEMNQVLVVIDTVGVWGSNPHAPTNPFNNLARTTSFSVDAKLRPFRVRVVVTIGFQSRHLIAHPALYAAILISEVNPSSGRIISTILCCASRFALILAWLYTSRVQRLFA